MGGRVHRSVRGAAEGAMRIDRAVIHPVQRTAVTQSHDRKYRAESGEILRYWQIDVGGDEGVKG